MSDSVYRKTALPVKLNLSDRNTRSQLSAGALEENGRGTLEGASSSDKGTASSRSQKSCADVMRLDLTEWLLKNGISGPPPSAEAEQRAMWQWIREFHKEYTDDWFAVNIPRLLEVFKPIFTSEMRAMKKAAAAAAAAAVAAAAPNPAGGGDLLSFDAPAVVAAPAAAAPAIAFTGGLLDMDDLVGPGPASAAVAASLAPPTAPAACLLDVAFRGAAPTGGANLLDLYAMPAMATPAPAPGVQADLLAGLF